MGHRAPGVRLTSLCLTCPRYNNIDAATDAKCFLEQRQRDEAKERKERNVQWETKVR